MSANATNAAGASAALRGPVKNNRKASTGIINQPNEYRVRQPRPTSRPEVIASKTAQTFRDPALRHCSSIRSKAHASPRKIKTKSMVDNPEMLKRQKDSVPKKIPAEIQAVTGSNKRRARKKRITTDARKSISLKRAMIKSGWNRQKFPPLPQKLRFKGMEKSNGRIFIRTASTTR